MRKINSISILRIIATLMIVMVHFGQSLPLPTILHKFVSYGAEGVTIFFIISGYLIAASLSRNSTNFLKKRIIRIVPSYFAVVVINLIASFVIGNYPADITHLSWLRYFLFIHAIVPTNDFFYWNNAAALWTMSAFWLFYLIAPIIHKFVSDGKGSIPQKQYYRSVEILYVGVLLSLISAKAYSCFLGGGV